MERHGTTQLCPGRNCHTVDKASCCGDDRKQQSGEGRDGVEVAQVVQRRQLAQQQLEAREDGQPDVDGDIRSRVEGHVHILRQETTESCRLRCDKFN